MNKSVANESKLMLLRAASDYNISFGHSTCIKQNNYVIIMM